MNERIQSIAEQASEGLDPEEFMGASEDFLKRFAELIVAECASACESATKEGEPLHLVSLGYSQRVKEHFGV